MAVRAQKQSDLEQLAQLLQLAGLASELQTKQQEIANTKHGQDLQAALGVMGLQQQQQAEVSKDTLARLGLAQSGQQFQQGQELAGQKLAQEGQYQQGELAQQKAGNALTGQKIAQDATIAGQQQGIEQNRIAAQLKAVGLDFGSHILGNPALTDKPELIQGLLGAESPEVGAAYKAANDKIFQNKLESEIYPQLDTLKADPTKGVELANALQGYTHEQRMAALTHLGYDTTKFENPDMIPSMIKQMGMPANGKIPFGPTNFIAKKTSADFAPPPNFPGIYSGAGAF